jgi:hypothetical protein
MSMLNKQKARAETGVELPWHFLDDLIKTVARDGTIQ